MGIDRLFYWKPETADDNLAVGGLLRHAASNQFGVVERGDRVWIVTVRDGELILLGRIFVKWNEDSTAKAAKRLDGDDDLYVASHHIIASTASSEDIREVPIGHLAESLRFESDRDRLNVVDGQVNAQQLQTMRVLTKSSATTLEDAMHLASATTKTGRRRHKFPPELTVLRRTLRLRDFNFLPPGRYRVRRVYTAVKNLFPDLCEDAILCSHFKKPYPYPEWQHKVRLALSKSKTVKNEGGYWIIRGSSADEFNIYPDEVNADERLVEGAANRRLVNAYERNPKARRKCIDHYGAVCVVCGMTFGSAYGNSVEGLIHVHHLRLISEVGKDYIVDPINDLRPVCPNCHAVIHSRKPMLTIAQAQYLLAP